jgi:hypothetical protein
LLLFSFSIKVLQVMTALVRFSEVQYAANVSIRSDPPFRLLLSIDYNLDCGILAQRLCCSSANLRLLAFITLSDESVGHVDSTECKTT